MFTFTFNKVVDGQELSYVLCRSSRSLAEHDIRLNGTRILQPVNYVRGKYGAIFDRGSQRNTLSFSAWRDVDFSDQEFADGETALAFALDMPGLLNGVGTLTMELKGDDKSYTRKLLNAGVPGVSLQSINGLLLLHSFEVNGGEIVPVETEK